MGGFLVGGGGVVVESVVYVGFESLVHVIVVIVVAVVAVVDSFLVIDRYSH